VKVYWKTAQLVKANSIQGGIVRGDELMYNWMPLLIGEGLHL
jgi:hypothetical protein